MTENTGRTPHPAEPAEGDPMEEPQETGRTPHPEQPAEGGDPAAGVDPENRVTGA
ncbi:MULTISPECIES: hypothetical protein [unclassified Modestobacter]|uniref:hypothetical protein n=1 Tax=unclassified Modestobacter TaxID=2643866 RepID=UPI0022AADEF9|nr:MULTISPECIES: hypothetical protein [unclassified Modestobacter]MCZ2823358.1 hypothetical protein [Modestobacter sp. VKM Ac-2981]MCZ2838157.1 hypothetical protein [Modestobacter sp. VKM Ac-2985]MCZ2851603.1 hypothetical protein [Modestobacter sp. VKM Ac-2982]